MEIDRSGRADLGHTPFDNVQVDALDIWDYVKFRVYTRLK